jgi:hypothetical protein
MEFEISFPEIPNNLPAARKRYQQLVLHEQKMQKLYVMLEQFLNEGKRGDVTDEYLADQKKRTDKSRKNISAEKNALEEKFKELQQDTTLQSKMFNMTCHKIIV